MFEPTKGTRRVAHWDVHTMNCADRDIANGERKKTVAAAVPRSREFISGGARSKRSMSGGVPAPVAYLFFTARSCIAR